MSKNTNNVDMQIAELKQVIEEEKKISTLRYQLLELAIVRCEAAIKINYEQIIHRINEIKQ